ncbi:hypothetical protein CHS0354_009311 [Potamilus streckersoni]|uniref:Uncharacterized protein n=1 Tax=Potamilus streckersoni TaxID=2493646 RepID=A0AAE0SN56_9BIVA|nr:hypothetical protein CHS0354_009311 [Potamilus streckersoni]
MNRKRKVLELLVQCTPREQHRTARLKKYQLGAHNGEVEVGGTQRARQNDVKQGVDMRAAHDLRLSNKASRKRSVALTRAEFHGDPAIDPIGNLAGRTGPDNLEPFITHDWEDLKTKSARLHQCRPFPEKPRHPGLGMN